MRFRRFVCAVSVVVTVMVCAMRSDAAGPTPMFRVFLKDGTPLVCWGEYARVGDRLVLTMPVGTGAKTAYEFVSIPVDRVDMARTERYAEAVRAAQFAASRGKAEYAELSERLSAELSMIAALPDPRARLGTAESARQQLIDWAATSHGYRSKEVQQLLQMFDSAIIDLRVAAGESRFSINLSAGTMPAAPVKLRAAPTSRETVELAVKAAAVAANAEVQRWLLRRARAALAALPKDDERTMALKATVDRDLAEAVRIDAAYRWLDADVRRLSDAAVERGDVLAIDALVVRVTRTDRLLGRQRPEDMSALLVALAEAKNEAAQQRLVLDHWQTLRGELVKYRNDSAGLIKVLDGLVPTLKAIQNMSGPTLTDLVTATRQTEVVQSQFAQLVAPEGVSAAHSLLGLAVQQTELAVRARTRAIDSRDLAVAREASAAADDALTRLAQGKAALADALKPPKVVR